MVFWEISFSVETCGPPQIQNTMMNQTKYPGESAHFRCQVRREQINCTSFRQIWPFVGEIETNFTCVHKQANKAFLFWTLPALDLMMVQLKLKLYLRVKSGRSDTVTKFSHFQIDMSKCMVAFIDWYHLRINASEREKIKVNWNNQVYSYHVWFHSFFCCFKAF